METEKTLLQTLSQQALAFTQEVCARWPARLAGSKACHQSANYIRETLATFCDRTDIQAFEVHPQAFLGYIRVNVILYFIALLLFWNNAFLLASLIVSLSVLITVMEFFIYKEFVDPFFPKMQGRNVIGYIEPEGEVRQQLIFSGHHDSAYIFNFLVNYPKLYGIRILAAMGSMMLMFLFLWGFFWGKMLGFELSGFALIMKWVFGLLSLMVIQLWFFYANKGTPGAGDNMASTAAAIEIGRHFAYLTKAAKGLQHTRLIIASWDAEEAGLRGARAFVNSNQSDLKSIPSYNFNIECLYDKKALFFLTSDINTFVPLSQQMADNCAAIAGELGYPSATHPIIFLAGGTDAAEFAKAGVEATTLVGMNWDTGTLHSAYHTPRDTIEAVDAEAVAACIDIGITYAKKLDEKIASSSKT